MSKRSRMQVCFLLNFSVMGIIISVFVILPIVNAHLINVNLC